MLIRYLLCACACMLVTQNHLDKIIITVVTPHYTPNIYFVLLSVLRPGVSNLDLAVYCIFLLPVLMYLNGV